jgi:hypothetical protein
LRIPGPITAGISELGISIRDAIKLYSWTKTAIYPELSRYVHVNPVRVGTQKSKSPDQQLRLLEEYRWSSLAGHLASHHRQGWIIYDEVLGQFGSSRSKYRQFVAEAIQEGYATPWKDLKAQVILGTGGFYTKLKHELVTPGRAVNSRQ